MVFDSSPRQRALVLMTLMWSHCQEAAAQPSSAPASAPASRPASQPARNRKGSEQPPAALDLPPSSQRTRPESRPAPPARGEAEYELSESVVLGQRRPEATAAAEYRIELGKLKIIPRRSAAEQLMLAPGVLTTNHGGEGHAHETYMRGFASKEGQEIEYTVDGVPLNDISNPHGHGYADIYFLPPEFVKRVEIIEGPFEPSQGDFAFAGSANYELAVEERGARLSYGLGSWNTQRLLLSYAPPDDVPGTFAGFELYQTDGFGPNRAAQRALGLGRYTDITAGGGLTWSVSAYGYAARFDQPGVVRQDDYVTGRVGFFDTYDPNQSGESNRLLLTFDTRVGPSRGQFRQVSWVGYRTMRLRANFTGWTTDVLVKPDGTPNVQRGDGLEMRYRVLDGGSRGSYALSRRIWGREQQLSLGYALRFDQGRSEQLRLRSVTAIPYALLFDDEFSVLNLAGWLRSQLRPLSWLALRGGLRVDAFSFGVTDLNLPSADREGARVPSQTSQSFGYAINPRVTLDFKLWRDLHLITSYGQGTRSVDASSLSDNETAPFARAHVVDGGLAHTLGREGVGLSVKTQLGYVFTHVDKDILFDPVSGRNIMFSTAGSSVLVGPTSRHAVLLGSRLGLDRWLDVLLNLGWARGTLDATGELLPYIPELVVRLDAAASGRLFDWQLRGVPVAGRIGLGFTYVPGRPLPNKASGDPYYLLNLGGQVRLWHLSVGLEMRNLLDLRYRQAEFNYASNFRGPDAVQSKRQVRHFTAGEPFFVMGTLTLHVEDLINPRSRRRPKGEGDPQRAEGQPTRFPPLLPASTPNNE